MLLVALLLAIDPATTFGDGARMETASCSRPRPRPRPRQPRHRPSDVRSDEGLDGQRRRVLRRGWG